MPNTTVNCQLARVTADPKTIVCSGGLFGGRPSCSVCAYCENRVAIAGRESEPGSDCLPPAGAPSTDLAVDPTNGQGAKIWEMWHTATEPGPQLIRDAMKLLPCGECRLHLVEMMIAHPPAYDLDAWRAWALARHNEVNKRLGRDEWTPTQAGERWGGLT